MTKITTIDVHLAQVFYEVLLDHARAAPGRSLRYKEALRRAKTIHVDDDVVQSAVPVSMGRRLDVIVQFVKEHQLPPLTCLAVNETGLPGASYKPVNRTWQADLDAVAAFDWAPWQGRWNLHVAKEMKSVRPFQRRKEEDASQMIFESFKAGQIRRLDPSERVEFVKLLMTGIDLRDAAEDLGLLVTAGLGKSEK